MNQETRTGPRAGFIGLGSQGLPMARRIARSGIPTTVWARRPGVAGQAAEWGARAAESPVALGAACDVVGVCVFDAAGVSEVLFGTGNGAGGVVGGMALGGVVTVHSTVSPAEIRAIARRAATHGVTVLDAPVSGGGLAADTGELLVLLGGPEAAANEAMPVIESYAGTVVRFAEVGSAQLAKLLNNSLLAAQVALVADAVHLGQLNGLGTELLEVLRAGSARSFALDLFARVGSVDGLARSSFGPAVGKDVRLLVDALGHADTGSALVDLAADLTSRIAAVSDGADSHAGHEVKGVTQT
jgi:3-hydroxyisobutyrate dehydrogenase-like beta-hydroxyacid dehydrogenase